MDSLDVQLWTMGIAFPERQLLAHGPGLQGNVLSTRGATFEIPIIKYYYIFYSIPHTEDFTYTFDFLIKNSMTIQL